jgi:hypothetical protein
MPTRTKPLVRRTLRVSVNSGLSLLVGWDPDLLNPIVEGLVDLMPWSRRLFSVSAPSQVRLDNTAIIKLKQRIVCSDGMCNGGPLHSVQWMSG